MKSDLIGEPFSIFMPCSRTTCWVIRQVGRGSAIDTDEVLSHLTTGLVPENDREQFLKIAKEEIAALHEGNYARYRLRPNEFKGWQKRRT